MSLLSSKSLRLALTVVMSVGAVSALSGCTDDEVVASALVIGAAAVVASGDRPDYHRYPRHDFDDRDGDRGFGRYDRGPGGEDHYPHAASANASAINLDSAATASIATISAVSATTAKAAAFKSSDARVRAVAKNYAISDYAATYIVRAIVMAQAKNTAGVKELGLKVSDFKDIYDGRALADDKIETLAAKLKMEKPATAELVANMTADVAAEKAARGL